MISQYNKKQFNSLLDFVQSNLDNNFFITKNNERFTISDITTLKLFLKSCSDIYVQEEAGDILGVVGVWKSVGNNVTRSYLKFSAKSWKNLNDLLKVFFWNKFYEVFIKIKKHNPYIRTLKENGFRFIHDRGNELLLMKEKNNVKRNHYNHFKSKESDS